jgi:hypothetical protein
VKIQPLRVLDRLSKSSGFRVGWLDSTGDYGYVRQSILDSLFEQLIVKSAGKRREAIYAYAAVSVVSGPMATKGLVEMSLLDEIASDRERGWTLVETKEAALEWERSLAQVGPLRVRELAAEKGPDLLRRTEGARRASERYVDLLAGSSDLDEIQERLGKLASTEQRGEATRLMRWPGVMRMVGAEGLYETVSLALVLFRSQVEEEPGVIEPADPVANQELMWRLQILADRLMIVCGIDAQTLSVTAPS